MSLVVMHILCGSLSVFFSLNKSVHPLFLSLNEERWYKVEAFYWKSDGLVNNFPVIMTDFGPPKCHNKLVQ